MRLAATLRHVLSVVLVTALLLALVPHVTSWAVPSQAKLDAAEERAAELERLVGQAEQELRQVEAELAALQQELADAEARLAVVVAEHAEAQDAATAASDRARAAEAQLEVARTELAANGELLGDLARDTLKYGRRAASTAMAMFETFSGNDDTADLADRLHYLQRGVGVRATAVERAEVLSVEVEHLAARAQAEEEAHQRWLADAEEKRAEAARLHARVQSLTDETGEKLDRSAQLVQTLESEQQDVDARIEELEQRVAEETAEKERREREERERRERERREREERERLERERQEREARERREREAAEQRAAEQRAQQQQQQTQQAAARPAPAPAPAPKPAPAPAPSTPIQSGPSADLRTVGGITVAASLAPQLQALLDHARRDGIVLGGSGYRSPEITARLRIANGCPDVYTAPPSSCRVPTAIPGSSEHEKGLAVDFTYQGQTICFPLRSSSCVGNPAFDWLQRNAGSYGLRNLPSEAWHWSTTGR
jgi:LAS superfamily LD-carboxypeptidase LdcB